ncbi:hypothetical protein FZEAL_4627 [Fusarium zealandicum]|uniref:DUF7580 domain-containing protein n=1 Tax=Fusarium zealandicum TaxID=1053134 RepID=A0A8H4ULX2_9HYPO|nr:hypothetical protein FZEAL_4627 [Fusarium zealandicum]
MSGLEVAGIVLGSLPLLISAIEHYKTILDPLKAFIKYQDELNRALRNLLALHTSLAMTLKILLRRVASEVEVIELMSNWQHELWKSNELKTNLKAVLKEAYGTYAHILGDIESDLESLANGLRGIDRWSGASNDLEAIITANPSTSSGITGRSQFDFGSRLKLALKKNQITKLVVRIDKRTGDLDDLIFKVERCEQWKVQRPTWKSSLSSSLEQIQERATNLHQIISRAWSCSAKAPHQVRLFLEHRMIRQKSEKQLRATPKSTDSTCFAISLRTPSAPENWHMAEIRVVEKEIQQGRLRFEEDTHKDTSSMANLPEVTDLCSIFCSEAHRMDCCGFAVDSKGKLRGMYDAPKPSFHFSNQRISLDDLLFPSAKARMRSSLRDMDRYVLAITLASSFLQLHATPWLAANWSRDDVFFLGPTNAGGLTVDIEHPFLAQSYMQHSKTPPDTTRKLLPTPSQGHCNGSNLLTLAKLLLEVKLNQKHREGLVKDSLEGMEEANKHSGVMDAIMLSDWIREEKKNLSWAWNDAVVHCMKCSVDPDMDLDDLNHRQGILNGVVVPLLEEYHILTSGPSRDL